MPVIIKHEKEHIACCDTDNLAENLQKPSWKFRRADVSCGCHGYVHWSATKLRQLHELADRVSEHVVEVEIGGYDSPCFYYKDFLAHVCSPRAIRLRKISLGHVSCDVVFSFLQEAKLLEELKLDYVWFSGKVESKDIEKFLVTTTTLRKLTLDTVRIDMKDGNYDDERKVEVWFTPEIPVSSGPGEYGQLPGMILEIDLNEGDRTITATAVEAGDVAKDVLKEPKKGKEVTSEEYREIVREKMKEMRAERGAQGGGHMMIIRQ